MRRREPERGVLAVVGQFRDQEAARAMSHPVQRPNVGIASLSIRDFRGIDQLDLDFRGPDGHPNSLVVLAGPNGCGKTAVLEAGLILIGGQGEITGPRGYEAIRRGAQEYEIRAEFQAGDQTWSCTDRSGNLPLHARGPVLARLYFSSRRAASLVGGVDPTVGKPGFHPAGDERDLLRNIKQLLVNAATIERFGNSPPQLVSYSAVIRRINEAWSEFYPDSGQTFAVEIVTPDRSITGSFDIFLHTPSGTRLEVDLLSSGQLELFLFLSALALNENWEGVIFIDEPELHLDPQWHRLIVRSLLRLQPRAQLIVATHSPEIFDAAASYERHFLVPENDPRSWLWAQHKTVGSGV